MAVYDTDADSATAIAAWLSQFKVVASGAITYVTGSHTYHVKWINRALQKIAWDFIISGDDEVNLSFPNPSKEEALGKIVTLNDHTADYSVNYTVTDEVMEYHFGGSVSQNDGDDIYYGLIVLGASTTPVNLQVIQDGAVVTSHWGTGINNADPNTQSRMMIKGRDTGTDTDGLRIVVKANDWGETFALWETTLQLGESVASISTDADPQNTTDIGDVRLYSISKSEGYNLLDIDGAGDKAFLGEWSYSPEGTKKSLYEFVKLLLTHSEAETLYGVDSDLWTGRIYDCVIGTQGTGTWGQNETLTWGAAETAGTGHLMGADVLDATATVRLILHLDTGVFPADAIEITGASTANGTVSGTPAKLAHRPEHLAQFTGAWIGAFGIGFAPAEVGQVDSFTSLDNEPVSPPNTVQISGTIEALDSGDDLHVFLAPKDGGSEAPDMTVYTCVGEAIGQPQIEMNEAIADDTPQAGWIGVLKSGTSSYKFYEYDSWAGSQFELVGVIADDAITASDPAMHAIFYDSMTGGGTTKTVSNSLIYDDTPIPVRGWIRHGDSSGVDKIIPISGTVGSGGFNFSGTMEAET